MSSLIIPSEIPSDVWNKLAYDLLAINPVVLANFGKTSTWALAIANKFFNATIQVLTSTIPMISIIKPLYTFRQVAQTRLAELREEGGAIDRAYQEMMQASAAYERTVGKIEKNPSYELFEEYNNTLVELQLGYTNEAKKHQDLTTESNDIEDDLAQFPTLVAALMQPILQTIRN